MSAPTPEERAEAVHDWAIQHEHRDWSDLEAEIARQIRAAEAQALWAAAMDMPSLYANGLQDPRDWLERRALRMKQDHKDATPEGE